MVSLLDLSEVTEDGVKFKSPVDAKTVLLTPEESIRTQQAIGSDVMMALDDVVSAELDQIRDKARIAEASARTTRWLDRCISAHTSPTQTLFGICQGHLDLTPGGFRDQCIADICARADQLGGIAIGGLSGGEAKEAFWKVVAHCCRKLPKNKPRYLMGVGYALDLVVCACLGVDMFDCVYATRTARFGTAFTADGELNVGRAVCAGQAQVLDEGCTCETCSTGVTRAYLHALLREGEPAAGTMISVHNVHFLLNLMRRLREAIIAGNLEKFVQNFLRRWCGAAGVPSWAVEALASVGIDVGSLAAASGAKE